MKIERTKNATRNIFFGVAVKIYQILGPFVLRTIFIYTLGMEYLGLNSLFTSVLSVLNLVELGVGSAMVFSMYKPIAEDNKEKICALMALYRFYYRIIGLVILVLGLIILPFVPKLITGTVPEDINIYILYLLNLSATVLSYWLFAYKNSLLSAHQRNDISSKITLIISTIQYVIQAVLLILVGNYYLYLVVTIMTTVLTNIITSIIVTKKYPQYKAKGKLDKKEISTINHRVMDLFTARLGGVVVNSADSIVISAFLGLTLLGMYNNYYYILSSVMGFISIIFNSCMAGIGNSLVTESLDKNYKDFRVMTFVVTWLIHISTVCFLCLYQPFMYMWVGKENMFDMLVVIMFCIYFYVCELSMIWATYKDAGGIWHEDRFRPLIGATVNLILNIFFVKVVEIGIYGILLSTIVSYVCISMPWLINNLFKIMFKRNCREYVLETIKHIFWTAISCGITYGVCSIVPVTGITQIILNFIMCMTIPNLVLYIVFRKAEEFKCALGMVKRVFHLGG